MPVNRAVELRPRETRVETEMRVTGVVDKLETDERRLLCEDWGFHALTKEFVLHAPRNIAATVLAKTGLH